MCVEPIIISLNLICEYVVTLVSSPHRQPLVIYHEGLVISIITQGVFILPNSADPGETPRFAASHLGLRGLYMFPFLNTFSLFHKCVLWIVS